MRAKKEKTFNRVFKFPLKMKEFFKWLKKDYFVNEGVVTCIEESQLYNKFLKEEEKNGQN